MSNERTLDQVISHYREASNQVSMPTPTAPPFVTPAPLHRPPYIVPNAFQQVTAPGVSRTIQHYMGPGATSQVATPPAPMTPPPIPRAGMTPSPFFHDPFQAMAQRNLAALPTSAAAINAAQVQQGFGTAGRWIGGGIGALGGAGISGGWGALQGASTGAMLGGWAGQALSMTPLTKPFEWLNQARWGESMAQQAGANRLRQGTFGGVQMMGGGGDITGTGLSAAGALGVVQQLGRGQGGMNRNDMINLAGAAAETGFLSNATTVRQIADTVKNLSGLMGELAKLTGDPDFRNNLRQLGSLRTAGFETHQAMRFMRETPMFSRMAGGAGTAMAGAQTGAALFQQAGLTPALGMQVGMATAGMVNRGMGGITATQQGLWGGQEGITQTMTNIQAQFLGGTGQMILPYVVERGPGGRLTINQKRLEAVRSGAVDMQEVASQGAARLAQLGIGSMQDLLAQAPELQTEMGQQLGGIGTMSLIENQAQRVREMQPALTRTGALGVVTGNMQLGREFAQVVQPETMRRMSADIDVQMRQERLRGRQAFVAGRPEEPGFFEKVEGRLRGVFGIETPEEYGRRTQGTQELRAWEKTTERAREEEAALGVTRVHHRPGMRLSQEEIEASRERGGVGLASWAALKEDPTTGMAPGRMSPAQIRASEMLLGGRVGGDEKSVDVIRKNALKLVQDTGATLRETQQLTEDQIFVAEGKYRKSMEEQFGEKSHQITAAIKEYVRQHAEDAGRDGRPLNISAIRGLIKKALMTFGKLTKKQMQQWMSKNGEMMVRWAMVWIDQTGSTDAKKALRNTKEAEGLALNAFSAENVEETEKQLAKDAQKGYEAVGFAASEQPLTEKEEEAVSAAYAEKDPTVRAAAMLFGSAAHAETEEQRMAINAALEKTLGSMTDDQRRRVQTLYKKFTPEQVKRMSKQLGGTIAKGTSIEAMGGFLEAAITGAPGATGATKGLVKRTMAAKLAAKREAEEAETGEGAGVTTPEAEKNIEALKVQKEMLQQMAGKLNKASDAMLKAANKIQNVDFGRLMPKNE